MSELRKAAEMALEVMEYNRANGTPNMGAAIEALRQALAQPEQVLTAKVVVTGREWVGLTDEERFLNDCRSPEEIEYAKAIEAKLKEKNT